MNVLPEQAIYPTVINQEVKNTWDQVKLLKGYIWPAIPFILKAQVKEWYQVSTISIDIRESCKLLLFFQITLFAVKYISTVWSNLRTFSQQVQKTAKLVFTAITMVFYSQGFSLFAKKFNFSCPVRTAYRPAGSQKCFTSHLSNFKDIPGIEQANQERCYHKPVIT